MYIVFFLKQVTDMAVTDVANAVPWAFAFLKLNPQTLTDVNEVFTSVHDIIFSDASMESDAICARDIVLSVLRASNGANQKETLVLEHGATPFQRLLVLILSKLAEYKLRRRGDACYYQIVNEDMCSMAWERLSTIREFIVQNTRRDVAPECWRFLTSSRENLDVLCKHLCDNAYADFPVLRVDSGLISWENGTYSIEDNVFWVNSCVEQWPQLATDAQYERKTQGWGDNYVLNPPDLKTASFHHIRRPFRVAGTSGMPANICTSLCNIGIGDDMQWWFFALIGRIFFPLNKHEKWHVVPFIKTSDATDQSFVSTLTTILGCLLGASHIGTIGSGSNLLHAPETIVNARVAILLMRDAPPMEQGDWQSATCGESVCINPRGRSSFFHEWDTHLLCVGSRMPYKNDAGTVERRVVMFDASVASDNDISALRSALCDDADLFLQTCVDHYLTAVHRHGDRQLWDILPGPFVKQRDVLREITNPLYSCLRSALFEHNPSLYMPLSEFKDIYQNYRRNRGLQAQRWIRDHWHATFAELKLFIERGQREYRGGGRCTTDWIIGIDCVEDTEHSAIITAEVVEQLENERTSCQAELARVVARHAAASSILQIDKSISDLKQQRAAQREVYRKNCDPQSIVLADD